MKTNTYIIGKNNKNLIQYEGTKIIRYLNYLINEKIKNGDIKKATDILDEKNIIQLDKETILSILDREDMEFDEIVANFDKVACHTECILSNDTAIEMSMISKIEYKMKEEKIYINISSAYVESILDKPEYKIIKFDKNKYKEIETDYSNKLLEILSRNTDSKESVILSIDDLREKFNIEENQYTRYADLKKRVLVPSVDALNELFSDKISIENSDCKSIENVEMLEIKDGRKVEAIEFVLK